MADAIKKTDETVKKTSITVEFYADGHVDVKIKEIDYINYKRIEDAYHLTVKAYQTRQAQLTSSLIGKNTQREEKVPTIQEQVSAAATALNQLLPTGVSNG